MCPLASEQYEAGDYSEGGEDMAAKMEPADRGADYIFSAVVLTALAWLVLEKCLFDRGANAIAHLFVSLYAMVPAALGIRRYRSHNAFPSRPEEKRKQNWRERFLKPKNMASALLMVCSGYFLILMILKSGFFLTGIYAVVFMSVPWTRIALCRNEFFAASVLVVLGALLALLTAPLPRVPFILLYAAWVFLLCGLSALLLVIIKARQSAGQVRAPALQ
jgi:hypothetical protein